MLVTPLRLRSQVGVMHNAGPIVVFLVRFEGGVKNDSDSNLRRRHRSSADSNFCLRKPSTLGSAATFESAWGRQLRIRSASEVQPESDATLIITCRAPTKRYEN